MQILISLIAVAFFVVMYQVGSAYPKKDKKIYLLAFYCLLIMTLMVSIPLWVQIKHSFTNTFLSESVSWRHPLLLVHIILATPCTLLAPLLVYKPYRRKFPKQHRFIGKLYVFGALISAILVLPLSLTNGGGLPAQIGFSTMSFLWFGFTLKAYLEVRNRKFAAHERWMLRSYAMTFAFVHVNVTYPLMHVYEIVNYDAMSIKILQSMVSWSVNLAAVEIFLRFNRRKKNVNSKKQSVDYLQASEGG